MKQRKRVIEKNIKSFPRKILRLLIILRCFINNVKGMCPANSKPGSASSAQFRKFCLESRFTYCGFSGMSIYLIKKLPIKNNKGQARRLALAS